MVNFELQFFVLLFLMIVDDEWTIFNPFNIWTLSVEQENSAKCEIYQLGHLYYLLQINK